MQRVCVSNTVLLPGERQGNCGGPVEFRRSDRSRRANLDTHKKTLNWDLKFLNTITERR